MNDLDILQQRVEDAEKESATLRTVLSEVVAKLEMPCPLDHTSEEWEQRTCGWCNLAIPAAPPPAARPRGRR